MKRSTAAVVTRRGGDVPRRGSQAFPSSTVITVTGGKLVGIRCVVNETHLRQAPLNFLNVKFDNEAYIHRRMLLRKIVRLV